jgi:pentatricopeptide repeat protein
MDCICRAGKAREVDRLLDEMKANGCWPDAITYRSIYFGLRKAGKMQEAAKFKKLAGK